MQTQNQIQTQSINMKNADGSPKSDVEILDEKVRVMTEMFQAAFDASEASFKDRFAVVEDTLTSQSKELEALKAKQANGVILAISTEKSELLAAASTAKEARDILYQLVDEEVAERGLTGSTRKVVHVERRNLIAGGVGVAVVSSAATVGTLAYIGKRRAAKALAAEQAQIQEPSI